MGTELIADLKEFTKRRSAAGFAADANLAMRAIVRLDELERAVADYERLGHGQQAPTNGTRTSNRAADTQTPTRLSRGRLVVLEALGPFGMDGRTEEEITEFTGRSGNTVRPRLIECRNAGWVEDVLADRPTRAGGTAKAWRLTDAGRLMLRTARRERGDG